jgi:hypothetical protein
MDTYDQREREKNHTVCPDCGEDLDWHNCGATPSDRTLRIRELNDGLRTSRDHIAVMAAQGRLTITRGIANRGDDFLIRAMAAVRAFDAFTNENKVAKGPLPVPQVQPRFAPPPWPHPA